MCRDVFEAIKSLYLNKQQLDLITIYQELKKQAAKTSYITLVSLTSLCQEATTISFVDSYIQIILKNSLRRRLIAISEDFFLNAMSPLVDTQHILSKTMLSLSSVECDQTSKDDLAYDLAKAELEEITKSYETYKETKQPVRRGISTFYNELDAKLFGLKPGELHILAARTGVGKTAFALNLIKNMCIDNKHKAIFFSLEMGKREIIRRVLSICSSSASWRMSSGVLSDEMHEKIKESVERLNGIILSLKDSGHSDMVGLRKECIRTKHKLGLDIIFIDYLQLMKSNTKKSFESRHVEVADITRGLKLLAIELNIPIVALSQLSRNVKDDERPSLCDLRESGSIEMDADSVLLLYKTIPDLKTQASTPVPGQPLCINLDVAKNRNGPTGTIQLTYRPDTFTFESVYKEQSASPQIEGLGS